MPGFWILPYFVQPRLQVGRVTLYAFGILVVTGILTARFLIIRRASRLGLGGRLASRLSVVMVLAGFAAAYVGKLIVPDVSLLLQHPAILLRSPKGVGSFGGLGGGLAAGWIWMRRRGLASKHRYLLLDNITYALPAGLLLGRLGCALAHDHRGLPSASWIAVAFPEGPRYDLGLIEFIFLIPMTAVFLYLGRTARPPGFFMALFGIIYGSYRIWQDTLHVQPLTYVGGAITCFVGLASWFFLLRAQHE